MRLANTKYFAERMFKRDPKLFLKKGEGTSNAYSRICASNMRKQPVILTDAEKEKIDREHPGSYEKAIRYGSDPKKPFWYICPRYWCLKDNTSLTEEEVKAGVCGGQVIPFGAKEVPKGKNIYEFTTPEGTRAHSDFFDKDGKYITHYPGFTKDGTHPDNLCIPCCFKNWNAPAQKKRRDQCDMSNMKIQDVMSESDKDVKSIPSKIAEQTSISDDYIKAQSKFPIEQNRWGFLPMSIQLFLNINNELCLKNKTGRTISLNKPCILRKGVENSKTQSFIACLADLYIDLQR